MRWILYVHKNKTNGKKYVGVSHKNMTEIWETVFDQVGAIKKALVVTNPTSDQNFDVATKKKAFKLLSRKFGSLEHDIACDPNLEFEHEVIFESNNQLKVLSLQKEKIKELGTKYPLGYNHSNGGELHGVCDVDDIIKWVKELVES